MDGTGGATLIPVPFSVIVCAIGISPPPTVYHNSHSPYKPETERRHRYSLRPQVPFSFIQRNSFSNFVRPSFNNPNFSLVSGKSCVKSPFGSACEGFLPPMRL